MIVWAIVIAVVGVWWLVMPRSWMLLGSRWTLKDGAKVEPSDAYVLYTRVFGIVTIGVAVAITIGTLVAEADRARRDRLEELWHIELRTRDDIVLMTDPAVVAVDEFPDVGDGEVVFDPSRAAVVGRDDLGDIGDTSALQDGDLLVSLGYNACAFSHLIVVEDTERVSVWIVVEVPTYDPIPGIAPADPAPDNELWESIEHMNNYTHCMRRFVPDDDDVGLRVIRVPLEQPLGDRLFD